MRVLLGTGVRLILIVALLAVLVAIPLVTVYRSTRCEGERRSARYEFVPPWDDPPAECRRNQSGFDLIRDELGLD
jgi:hypothetical protein